MTTNHQGSRRAIRRHRPSRAFRPTLDPVTGSARKGFETRRQALAEDKVRVRLIETHLVELKKVQQSGRIPSAGPYSLDRVAARALRRKLQRGIRTGVSEETLGSNLYMRSVRDETIGALSAALEEFADEDLRIVTVINRNWAYHEDRLDQISANKICCQFRNHLSRGGVTAVAGPLVAFLHGEFDSNGRVFQIHFHLVTTTVKAAALKKGLRKQWGYVKTVPGSNPITAQELTDRPCQLSYLLKAFWPDRPIFWIDGVPRRVREVRRIKDIAHTQVLLWLDRCRIQDLMLVTGCVYRHGRFHIKC